LLTTLCETAGRGAAALSAEEASGAEWAARRLGMEGQSVTALRARMQSLDLPFSVEVRPDQMFCGVRPVQGVLTRRAWSVDFALCVRARERVCERRVRGGAGGAGERAAGVGSAERAAALGVGELGV